MKIPSQLRAGARNPADLLHHPAVSTGLATGVLLTLVMVVSLIVANRVPASDSIASVRNAICSLAFAVVMAIPVLRFLYSPSRLFTAGMTAWITFDVAYQIAGIFFTNLANRTGKSPFLALVLGAIVYGFVAVASWVLTSLFSVLRQPAESAHSSVVISSRHR